MSGPRYASGKNAHGFCDRCGFRYQLTGLHEEFVQGRGTGIKTCTSCHDPDHPQNWLGRTPVDDPQALRDARPDPALAESRVIPDSEIPS